MNLATVTHSRARRSLLFKHSCRASRFVVCCRPDLCLTSTKIRKNILHKNKTVKIFHKRYHFYHKMVIYSVIMYKTIIHKGHNLCFGPPCLGASACLLLRYLGLASVRGRGVWLPKKRAAHGGFGKILVSLQADKRLPGRWRRLARHRLALSAQR